MKEKHKSFIEVLQDEIRAELENELRAEYAQLNDKPSLGIDSQTQKSTDSTSRVAYEPTLWSEIRRFANRKAAYSGTGSIDTSARRQRPKANPKSNSKLEENQDSQSEHSNEGTKSQASNKQISWTVMDHLNWQIFHRHGAGPEIPNQRDELKRIFRKLALRLHPDRVEQKNQKQATERFVALKSAFDFLDGRLAELETE